jgi:hypothetical protein
VERSETLSETFPGSAKRRESVGIIAMEGEKEAAKE